MLIKRHLLDCFCHRNASFWSDSKFGDEHKWFSTPLGRLGASKGEGQRSFWARDRDIELV